MNTCAKPPSKSASRHGSLWLRTIPHNGWTEFLLGATPGTQPNPARWAVDLENFLIETEATLVELDAFGDTSLIATLREGLAKWLAPGFPASLMLNSGNHAPDGGGVLVRAVIGVEVRPVTLGTHTIGFRFED
ncbi:MAG: hypothetical protein K9N23_20510, partial [Akkermansiaceae bacterium]|nr:hypothetical protein [Akkermansiaceae bacterium]